MDRWERRRLRRDRGSKDDDGKEDRPAVRVEGIIAWTTAQVLPYQCKAEGNWSPSGDAVLSA